MICDASGNSNPCIGEGYEGFNPVFLSSLRFENLKNNINYKNKLGKMAQTLQTLHPVGVIL